MRWISRIALDNYRAFAGRYDPIEIAAGQHLLIYGENGSGKSSFYAALRDFFISSDTYKPLEFNRFDKSANPGGSVTVDVIDLDTNVRRTFRYSETDDGGNRFPEIQIANKLKGFLDYRRLLQTHLIESVPGTNPNLFSLVIEELLADHYISQPGGKITQIRLGDEWARINSQLGTDRRKRPFKEAAAQLPILESMLKPMLTTVFAEAKRLLSTYYESKMDFDVQFRLAYDAATGDITKDLLLTVEYAKENIVGYQLFLNEARLSALAICVYLALIKTRPLSGPGTALGGSDTLKVLFLDDVFIGLDTGNRIPLLEMLGKEFIQSGFQLFISTYDRYWFETARQWFTTEHYTVKSIELFADDHDNNPAAPDTPIVVDPCLSYLEKAKAYYRHKDYPAAANYLRKACEADLRRIMPRHLQLAVDLKTGEVKLIGRLDTLVNNFDTYIAKNGLNTVPFRHFKTYKKILLNPLSHDDLLTPHYGQEIRDGIALVEELKKIQTKEIVLAKDSQAKPMKLEILDHATGATHLYQVRVLENLQIIKQDVGDIQLSVVDCVITEAGQSTPPVSLQAALDQIRIDRGHPSPTDYMDYYKKLKLSNTKRLIDVMQF